MAFGHGYKKQILHQMPCETKLERMQQKNTSTVARVPTVPTVVDSCTSGWLTTDIYEAELFINRADSRSFTRVTAGIRELPWMADLSGNLFNSLDLSLGTNDFNLDRGDISTKVISNFSFAGSPPSLDVSGAFYDNAVTQMMVGVFDGLGLHSISSLSWNRTREVEIGFSVLPDIGIGSEFANIHFDDTSLGNVLTECTVDLAGAILQYDDGTVISQHLSNVNATQMAYTNVNGNRVQVDDTGFICSFNSSDAFRVLTAGDIQTNQGVANVNAIPANSAFAIEIQTIAGVSMFIPAFAAQW